LYIKEGIELDPLKTGGTGILSEVPLQPEGMPIYYEAGTPNTPGVVSLNTGVEFVLKTGLDNILAHKKHLVDKITNAIKDFPEVTIYSNGEHSSGSVLCFNIQGMVPEEVGFWLESSYDMEVRTGLHCAPLLREAIGAYPWGTVRVSPSYFTTDAEMDVFIEAINDMISFMRKNASRKG
jgi:selenocysteine lyase/cysteine desulfurase